MNVSHIRAGLAMWPAAAGSAALGIGASGPPLEVARALLAIAAAIALQAAAEFLDIKAPLRTVAMSVLSIVLVVGAAYAQHGHLGWQTLIAALVAALLSYRAFWPIAAIVCATLLFFFA